MKCVRVHEFLDMVLLQNVKLCLWVLSTLQSLLSVLPCFWFHAYSEEEMEKESHHVTYRKRKVATVSIILGDSYALATVPRFFTDHYSESFVFQAHEINRLSHH